MILGWWHDVLYPETQGEGKPQQRFLIGSICMGARETNNEQTHLIVPGFDVWMVYNTAGPNILDILKSSCHCWTQKWCSCSSISRCWGRWGSCWSIFWIWSWCWCWSYIWSWRWRWCTYRCHQGHRSFLCRLHVPLSLAKEWGRMRMRILGEIPVTFRAFQGRQKKLSEYSLKIWQENISALIPAIF